MTAKLVTDPDEARKGLLAATAAFLTWGLLPIYWKLLDAVPAMQLLAHRTLWSLILLLALLVASGRLAEARAALRIRRNLWCLAGGSVMLAVNWGLYIWAVTNGHIIESALGYYITPLVNVILGRLVFKDRLQPLQILAIALAAIGVGVMLVRYGHFPWLALAIALSFALYGMFRKLARMESLPGLFLETIILSPLMLAFLIHQENLGLGAFLHRSAGTDLLIALSGLATSVPLLLFAYGARRISFITVGLLQYLTPTMALLIGCLIYGEEFRASLALGFACIWGALALYTYDGLRRFRFNRKARRAAPTTQAEKKAWT